MVSPDLPPKRERDRRSHLVAGGASIRSPSPDMRQRSGGITYSRGEDRSRAWTRSGEEQNQKKAGLARHGSVAHPGCRDAAPALISGGCPGRTGHEGSPHPAPRTSTSECRSPQHPPSAIQLLPSNFHHPASTIQLPPSKFHHPNSTIQLPPSNFHPPSVESTAVPVLAWQTTEVQARPTTQMECRSDVAPRWEAEAESPLVAIVVVVVSRALFGHVAGCLCGHCLHARAHLASDVASWVGDTGQEERRRGGETW
ncbi:unnamed protein product [Diplocarpon coronariae]